MNPLEELHDYSVKFAERCYADNTNDEDYDMVPMAAVAFFPKDSDGKEQMVLIELCDGSPIDLLRDEVLPCLRATLRTGISMISTILPAWTRDPLTGERNGECVMVMTETEAKRMGTLLEIKRNPNAVIVERHDGVDDAFTVRAPLLFNKKPMEH